MSDTTRITRYSPKTIKAAVLRLVPMATPESMQPATASSRRDPGSLMARRLVAHRLRKQGYSLPQIAKCLGLASHGTVHAMLNQPMPAGFLGALERLDIELEKLNTQKGAAQ